MRARVLIVDGHSMIFQWPELSALHAKNGVSARTYLTRIFTSYQDTSGIHVIIVFDGKGNRTSEDAEETGIQIFYSKSGQTADSVIERLVATYASKYDIMVATDDHLERTTVESFGGTWISSEQLAIEIRNSDADLRDRIKQLKRR